MLVVVAALGALAWVASGRMGEAEEAVASGGAATVDDRDDSPMAVPSTPERELRKPVGEARGIDASAASASTPTLAQDTSSPTLPAISGTVVDSTGSPLGGVEVSALVDQWSGYDRWETDDVAGESVALDTTDEAGRFSLRLQRESLVTVTARAVGRPTASVAGCLPGGVVTLVLGEGASVTGAVTAMDSGAPVQGALVHVYHGADGDELVIVETDAAGHYRAAGLVSGEGGVLVVSREYVMPRRTPATLQDGQVLTVNVEVERGWTLEGRVTDMVTGDPIAGAAVSPWNFMGEVVSTNDQGFYRVMGAAMRPGTLYFDAQGYGRTETRFQGPGEQLDAKLARSRRVTGAVVDDDGEPIRGAVVVAAGLRSEGLLSRQEWSATRSADDGRFELDGLRSDLALTVQARAPGRGAATVDLALEVPPSGVDDIGVIRLSTQGILGGRVIDGGGEAVADAYLELLGPKGTEFRDDVAFHFGRITGSADAGGAFLIPGLAPGSWQLRAYEPGGRVVEVAVAVGAGEALRDLVVQLPSGEKMEGRVVDAEGRGVEGAFVRLYPEMGQGGPLLAAECSAAGEFEIDDVPEGTFTVMAGGPTVSEGESGPGAVDYVPTIITGASADGSLVNVTLDRLDAKVTGLVVDGDGRPVENAFVSVALDTFELPWEGVLTDGGGAFELGVRSTAETELLVWRTDTLKEGKIPTGDEWQLGRDILDEEGPAGRGTVAEGSTSVRIQIR